jgi:hypothetical protein
MPLKTTHNKLVSGYRIMTATAILIILIPLGYSIMSSVISPGGGNQDIFLEMPDPKYTECVKETEYMRYHHWELLRSIREEVVRYGIRGEINLNRCKECHTSRDRFCNRCHNAVSLSPDCFDCHYYP